MTKSTIQTRSVSLKSRGSVTTATKPSLLGTSVSLKQMSREQFDMDQKESKIYIRKMSREPIEKDNELYEMISEAYGMTPEMQAKSGSVRKLIKEAYNGIGEITLPK